jgi:precorrin-6Y C5,15-methyltransferase (decarboxylating)
MEYILIGIQNHPQYTLPEEVRALLPAYKVFSGGKRHYALVKHHLPINHTWISIGGNMPELFSQYRAVQGPILVFASGDPLFYGIAQTIQQHDPEARLSVYPSFTSVQRLCTKINQPYQQARNTSVHGRSWKELDTALLQHEPLIAVLTDTAHTPSAIAQRLLEYRFTTYEMIVGEDLDGLQERVATYTLEQAAQASFHALNCVLLRQTRPSGRSFGIHDSLFTGLPDRPNMITKKAIRLASLSNLQLERSRVFWDIGFCTGSIAIEAQRLFPHLQVVAFEKREECRKIMQINTRALSVPGIEVHIGDFFEWEHALLPPPDAVFIGGHGNRLTEMMQCIDTYIARGGRIGFNAVQESSRLQFTAQAVVLGWEMQEPELIRLDQHNPIWIVNATKG